MTKDKLELIPGVGPSIAADLYNLGFKSIEELKDKDPEEMYEQLMNKAGVHIDRCILYVFRTAVYYASNEIHNPEKLKWWNWKDEKLKH